MYYYSKINDKKIIFSLFKFNDFKKNRIDFTPDTEYLQASCSLLNKNKTIVELKIDDEILLETDETNVGGELLLDGTDSSSTNAGGKFISETLTNRFIDFEGIEIQAAAS